MLRPRRARRPIGTLATTASFIVALAAATLVGSGPGTTDVVGADDTLPTADSSGDELLRAQSLAGPLAETAEVGTSELTGAASKYLPITPIRALDTRSDPEYGTVYPRSSISLDPVTDTGVAAAAGVDPDDITAVIVNTTVINADGSGYATMWPTGTERLTTATNNTQFDGHTIGNLVVAPLGLEHKISFYASTGTDVTIDVLGVFVATTSSTDGRFVELGPVRHTDTRDGTPMDANEKRTFDLTTAGVPADATGVVMNVTAFHSNGRGYYTVWESGATQPNTANVNVLGVDYAAGNQVITGLTDGKVDIFTNVGSELTIDITGYFTGSGEADTTDGLFVPFSPQRFLDTREPNGSTGQTGGSALPADQRFTLDVAGVLDVPTDGVKAVAFNFTGNQSASRGFIKAFPSGASEPATSSLNFTTGGQTVPNHAITTLDPSSGAIDILPSIATHLIVDATGYFLDADGTLPTRGGVDKVVDPGEFVPTTLGDAPTAEPYDFLFDRATYLYEGVRPSPTKTASYDVCLPIRYALNIDLANDVEIADLIASVEDIEQYTGIDFQYAGVTSAGMNIDDDILQPERSEPEADLPYQYLPPGADVVIGYSNPTDTPRRSSGVIGVGGGLRTLDGEMFRGFAVIYLDSLRSSSERKSTATHELGHMMGLGHVSDFDPFTGAPSTAFQGLDPNAGNWDSSTMQDQLMYPQLSPQTTFSTGDAHGLWQLYGTQSCSGSPLTTSSLTGDDIDWSQVDIAKEI